MPVDRDASTKAIHVRPIAADEHSRIGELTLTAYTHDYEVNPGYAAELGDVAGPAHNWEVWVAEDPSAGRLLGSVVTPRPGQRLTPLAGDGELDFRMLAVDPSARQAGVGRILVEHVIGLARARGARRVFMNSGPQMTAAHRLYHRLGFVRLPDRETYVLPNGVTLLAFGFDLSTPARPEDVR